MALDFTADSYKKPVFAGRHALFAAVFIAVEILLFLFVDKPLTLSVRAMTQGLTGVVDFFMCVTELGEAVWFLVPSLIVFLVCVFLVRRNKGGEEFLSSVVYLRARAFFVLAAVGISGVLVNVVKLILGRARPLVLFDEGLYGFYPFTLEGYVWRSMPSGHTTTAFAIACCLSLAYPRFSMLWLFFAGLIGVSRIVVSAHYLSDVLAGALLGWIVTLFVYNGMVRLRKLFFPLTGVQFSSMVNS